MEHRREFGNFEDPVCLGSIDATPVRIDASNEGGECHSPANVDVEVSMWLGWQRAMIKILPREGDAPQGLADLTIPDGILFTDVTIE